MAEKNQLQVKSFFEKEVVQEKFKELLGKNHKAFVTSVLQIVSNNSLLKKADPKSIYNAACTAAILDLPLDSNLGYSYIVPYKGKAQFQLGWRGYYQLAKRTGLYDLINSIEVYENQFISYDAKLMQVDGDFSIEGKGKIVGYLALIREHNSNNTVELYWSVEKVRKHAKKFSQSYGKNNSPWTDHFDAMAKKTVLKHLLKDKGVMTIDFANLRESFEADQAVLEDDGYTYVDNIKDVPSAEVVLAKEEKNRINIFIDQYDNEQDLQLLLDSIDGLDEYGEEIEKIKVKLNKIKDDRQEKIK